MQYDKTHAVTVVLTGSVGGNRFVSYAGAHASATAGGRADAQGVSETSGLAGDAVSVITHYSAVVESGAAIVAGAFVKPAADGTGRAVTGSADDHCGRALTAAADEGAMIEVEIYRHLHA